jgi:uracil-DNA glycosylase
MTTKQDQLKQLHNRMQQDMSLPLRADATQLVFGEGNPDAKLYFLGEAPGQSEDKQGRPFVGRAGKLLNTLLEGIGMQRADVYISNIVRFRPPNNRPPASAEIAAFLPYVNEEITIIQPLLIVTLGRFSLAKFLPADKITQVHGTLHTADWQGRPIHVFPLYHPAAALRSPQMRSALEEDFNKIPSVLAQLQSLHQKGP